jgi:hypothetical protein
MFHDDYVLTPTQRRCWGTRALTVFLGTAVLAAPVTAHGAVERVAGLPFPVVVAASIGASLFGGGVVLAAVDRLPRSRAAVPSLFLVLGGLSVALAFDGAPVGAALGVAAGVGVVALARGHNLTDCGACADAALGAVTLHRGLEGVVLATVYAADAALGLLGAAVLVVHAAAETAAVGSLYAATGRQAAIAAVCLLQMGFVGGVAAGWGVVDGVSPAAEAGLLALVGGVLLAVGTRESYSRYADRRSASAASADVQG